MTPVFEEYRRAWAFLKRLLRPFLLLLLLFLAVAVAAHFILEAQYRGDPAMMRQHMSQLMAMLDGKDLLDENGRLSAWALFLNNFLAAGMAVVTGLMPFLFIPLATLSLNASVIGVLSAIIAVSEQGSLCALAVSVLPHGIFEIPALLIGVAMGCTLCLDISARMLRRRRDLPFLALLFEIIRLSALVVVPLLAVAAVIETYGTPALMDMLL